ncbi:MAG: hypothetical protein J7480_02985 [Microbacteriaceae bacterium]|nr:hypothetical protein [Microbacteriaceae bacterium]
MSLFSTTHPPHSSELPTGLVDERPEAQQPELAALSTVLPRLALVERLALRVALRGILRLDRFGDRDAQWRRHELDLANERRVTDAERAILLDRPFR